MAQYECYACENRKFRLFSIFPQTDILMELFVEGIALKLPRFIEYTEWLVNPVIRSVYFFNLHIFITIIIYNIAISSNLD